MWSIETRSRLHRCFPQARLFGFAMPLPAFAAMFCPDLRGGACATNYRAHAHDWSLDVGHRERWDSRRYRFILYVSWYENVPLSIQQILIDGSGHLLGRLASVVAKAILQGIVVGLKESIIGSLALRYTLCVKNVHVFIGQRIVLVRCEDINISGSFYRNKRKMCTKGWIHIYFLFCSVKYLKFLKLRCNVKPSRGPFHLRAPSRIFWRTVRGMIPHKTKRGAEALNRLKVYEGIPPPYDKKKRMVVPCALRVLRLKPGRKVNSVVMCVLCVVSLCQWPIWTWRNWCSAHTLHLCCMKVYWGVFRFSSACALTFC